MAQKCVLLYQEAPEESKCWLVADWSFGFKGFENLSWHYKEDDARAEMNRREHPSSGRY